MSSMIIKTKSKSGGTIYLRNSDIKRPKLRSIDIIKGSSGQETTGSVTDGIAWVLVSEARFNQLNTSAIPGEKISLTTAFNSDTQTEEVSSVRCPAANLSLTIETLSRQHVEMQRINEEKHHQLLELVQRQGDLLRQSEERLLGNFSGLRTELNQLIGNLPIPRNTEVRALIDGGQQKVGGE